MKRWASEILLWLIAATLKAKFEQEKEGEKRRERPGLRVSGLSNVGNWWRKRSKDAFDKLWTSAFKAAILQLCPSGCEICSFTHVSLWSEPSQGLLAEAH